MATDAGRCQERASVHNRRTPMVNCEMHYRGIAMIVHRRFGSFLLAASRRRRSGGSSSGSSALTLSAIVGELSPQRAPTRSFFDVFSSGNAEAPHPKGLRIAVKADDHDSRRRWNRVSRLCADLRRKEDRRGRKAMNSTRPGRDRVVLEGAAGTSERRSRARLHRRRR